MVLLSVAVAVLAALVLADLILSAAIVRRLRDTEKRLIEITTPPESGMAPGETMPEFTTTAGEVTHADLAGRPSLVAFFSTTCRHCPAQAERLAVRADDVAARGVTVLSALTVADDGTDTLSPLLAKAGRVVTGTAAANLMQIFRAGSTPTMLLFDAAGQLTATGHDLDEVLGGR